MRRLLVANRGEIALRIARTARRMGIETVAVFSDADADARHVRELDAAVRIGPAPAAQSYLCIDALLAAAAATGADAVHPGYGFLAESPEFADACATAGLLFVGPSAAAMRALGNKARAKQLLAGSGVPILPGYHGANQSQSALCAAAQSIGVPLMIKAAAGGGGRGMRLVLDATRFSQALESARSEALAAFGSAEMLLERALLAPRHIEVQVFADAFGGIVHLGERDCSIQRRHQKLIEEGPSPAVDDALRERLGAAAVAVCRTTAYIGAATVEFLLAPDGSFFFIEVNARLQVEHGVTEAIADVDLVEWQLRVARGERLPRRQDEIVLRGHAIEARLCAEDPAHGFLPQTGTLVAWQPPSDLRIECALETGIEISPHYDSMIAKFIAAGETREDARLTLAHGLETCIALGVPTNAAALAGYLRDADFIAGAATTSFIEERQCTVDSAGEPPPAMLALAAGLHVCSGARGGDFGPWTAWNSAPLPAHRIRLAFGDGPATTIGVTLHSARNDNAQCSMHLTASVGTEAFMLDFIFMNVAGGVRARVDSGSWRPLTFVRTGAYCYFHVAGQSFAVRDCALDVVATARAIGGDGFVRAPMTGRVVSVGGNAGDRVASGGPLVVIEAMKMEHTLSVPMDIVVREVTAVAGRQVQANEILLSYDPEASPATR